MAWYNQIDRMNENNRLREINDANRYGTPNGSHQSSGGSITQYRNGKPVSVWSPSTDSHK